LQVRIEQLVHRGLGLARVKGKVVFVAGTIPGELVEARVVEEKPSYCHALLLQVLEPSGFRVRPECVYLPECGGCQLAHIAYLHQLELKKSALLETMRRVGKFDPGETLQDWVGAESALGYRSRLRLHVSGRRVGFKAFQGNRLVEVGDCLLANQAIRDALPALKEIIRASDRENEFEVELDSDPETSKVYARFLGGKREIYFFDRTSFVPASISARELKRLLSFTQTNPSQNQKMVSLVSGLVRGAERGLELFAGSGNLSFGLAAHLKKLVSVERDGNAVQLARLEAREKVVANIDFICQSADRYLQDALEPKLKFDLVVLDPPRTGAKSESALIARLSPEKIIYVSCEPSTLARDLRTLLDAGYKLEKMIPIDMFPQTFHIETVSLLTKG
jgi:23S rRNA (uracil1939-C5)-methyltransferase